MTRWTVFLLAGTMAFGQRVDFGRDVRPILSENCFHCHGPDGETRQAGLRLDTQEGLFSRAGVVQPGQAVDSRLYQRMSHEKPALRMPPPHARKVLTPAQIETVRRWIDEGARWQGHWSFRPPVRPAVPPSRKVWARNPIDSFILARLEMAKLEPEPEADRRALIRRLSLDLTGLPPPPGEVRAFVRDKSADYYEKAVDRLLASPHWGEHRARYWLDAARYADTHGLHADNYREIWPYRDWVIRAFNRNLPFDQFTIDQIAGDLLPEPRTDQLIATGFQRCNITTNEGGVIPDEVEVLYARDRVETTATVWLGLTLGCASCHDHKFDPLTQKEFYQFAAFFMNTTQKPLDGSIPSTPPTLVIPRPEDKEAWREHSARADELRLLANAKRDAAATAFEAWLRAEGHRSFNREVSPAPILKLPKDSAEATLEFNDENGLVFENMPAFQVNKPFTIAGLVKIPEQPESVIASFVGKNGDGARWVLAIRAMFLQFGMQDPQSGRLLQTKAVGVRLPPGGWEHIGVTYDGSGEESGITLYVGGRAMYTGDAHDGYTGWQRTPLQQALLRVGSDGVSSLQGGALRSLAVYPSELSGLDMQLLAVQTSLEEPSGKEKISGATRESLRHLFLSETDAAYRDISQRLDRVERVLRNIRRRSTTTLIMQERTDKAPAARVLARGQYDQPGETVSAAVPAVLGRVPREHENRLGLAKWLVSPENPLTARVIVNRFWQEVFGAGLVKTSEDFGATGEPPSHPELLDWLAVEFRESGWDVKRLFKLMVTSAAYRQSAAASAEKRKLDPENRLISRAPRFRMDAEMIRDSALAASGLLVRKIGGPSVKPYQPDGVWETVAVLFSDTRFYRRDAGDNLYRRGLYTFWKRSAPPASMEIFNAPTRESCTVRRERTNTPLQALATMNDPQFMEASRHLAGSALRQATFDSRLNYATERILARRFRNIERVKIRSTYRTLLAHYTSSPPDAAAVISVGETRPHRELPAAQLAAWTMLVNTLFNLDEALNK